jgi:hypothetical protein
MRTIELTINFIKGGEGSGNFDHEGRPGEVGGSSIVSHATPIHNAESIKENGLRASTILDDGDRPASVYFVDTELRAHQAGRIYGAQNEEGKNADKYALVRFKIPDGEAVLPDTVAGKNAFRIERDVPKEWIEKIEVYSLKGELLQTIKGSETNIFYTAVPIKSKI